jgi:hypothetical protein
MIQQLGAAFHKYIDSKGAYYRERYCEQYGQ